jgi:hypothetical protein
VLSVNDAAEAPAPRGLTPAEVGRLLRIGPDRVRSMVRAGELGAIDTAPPRSPRPRYIVLPQHLEAYFRRRSAARPQSPPRRRRRAVHDYYPGD